MPRDIILVRYPAAPFKDHWAIFIPSTADPNFGTLIQVEGDVKNGFTHNIRRNYNTKATRRSIRQTVLAKVADKHVHATPSSGAQVRNDTNPRDDIERVALTIPAPGPSMNQTSGNAVRSYPANLVQQSSNFDSSLQLSG